jgi:hypothetical protein
MVRVSGNKIYISKKNSAILNFTLINADNSAFKPSAEDRVVFSVKKYVASDFYIIQKDATLSNNIATIKLTADELDLPTGSYSYDLKIFHSDGREETIITPSLFKVEEVVNYD